MIEVGFGQLEITSRTENLHSKTFMFAFGPGRKAATDRKLIGFHME